MKLRQMIAGVCVLSALGAVSLCAGTANYSCYRTFLEAAHQDVWTGHVSTPEREGIEDHSFHDLKRPECARSPGRASDAKGR